MVDRSRERSLGPPGEGNFRCRRRPRILGFLCVIFEAGIRDSDQVATSLVCLVFLPSLLKSRELYEGELILPHVLRYRKALDHYWADCLFADWLFSSAPGICNMTAAD